MVLDVMCFQSQVEVVCGLKYLQRATTLDRGIFCSHSVHIKILSNFSYVGFGNALAHVYVLGISSSLRFKLSITLLMYHRQIFELGTKETRPVQD
jgi:hypothetical protein